MSFFAAMNTSASGLTAQRLRMDVIAQNIANATTTGTPEGGPYRRKTVIMNSVPMQQFDDVLDQALAQNRLTQGRRAFDRFESVQDIVTRYQNPDGDMIGGVQVTSIRTDHTPGPLVYDPTHPHANEEGYVEMPNVNIVYEMVNMMSASRSYEANMTALSTTRSMITSTLQISQAT